MTKKEFFLSCKGEKLHCIEWRPEGDIVAALQIVHGMVEHVERYNDFAVYLASRGILVVGHDHPGHGKTAPSENDLGYIDMKNGGELLIECTERVGEYIRESYPEVGRFILGHSMGSFVVRRYITRYSDYLCGAIIMGTGTPPTPVLFAGRIIASLVALFKGERHPSELLKKLSFSGYNRLFSKDEGDNAWLSSDRDAVKKYDDDPLCGYTFTAGGFRVLYDTLYSLARKKDHENIKRTLPVLITSGEVDPVGEYAKGPEALFKVYKKLGMEDVTLTFYPRGRHEILNETFKGRVYEDIYSWITGEQNGD